MDADSAAAEVDAALIYAAQVVPALGVTQGGSAQPLWIFLGGQQGSGKTTLRAKLMQELGAEQTQVIAADDLKAFLPQTAPDNRQRRALLMDWTERLIERACTLGAHVIWEQPVPDYAIEYAAIARTLGFRTECRVLALPAIESWLATLHRDLDTKHTTPNPTVPWSKLMDAYHRWPAFLALAEKRSAFDRVTVLDRLGQVHFDNQLHAGPGSAKWENQPFACESLVVERNQPRSAADILSLAADWDRLRDAGLVTLTPEDRQGFAEALSRLQYDPASGFDLYSPDPALAPLWIARLQEDLTATLASPEGQAHNDLANRCQTLVALVAQVAGQPIR